MRAVTIEAFGRGSIAQLGNLSVKRLKIAFGDLGMTPAALVHDIQTKSDLIGASDRMRGMAIITNRQRIIRL